jgi:4-oxalocrotonate tautomerase
MPFIRIDILAGRSDELKRKLYEEVTNTVEKTIHAPRENIRVVITEIPKENWVVGGVSIADRQKKD